MTRYKTILVALDASPRADGVLESATELARATGAKLLLFHAVGFVEVPVDAFASLEISPNDIPDVLAEHARHDLARRAKTLPPDLLRGEIVQIGVPWQSICRVAVESDVDLIVLGSHGFSGLDRLLGTTASRVVNHADRPVLVVRPKPVHPPV